MSTSTLASLLAVAIQSACVLACIRLAVVTRLRGASWLVVAFSLMVLRRSLAFGTFMSQNETLHALDAAWTPLAISMVTLVGLVRMSSHATELTGQMRGLGG